MPISIDESSGAVRLTGALEIYDAESVRAAVLEALAHKAELRLDLREVLACDAAGAQLLWAAQKMAATAGKVIRFEHVAPAVREAWAALGMAADFFTEPSVAHEQSEGHSIVH